MNIIYYQLNNNIGDYMYVVITGATKGIGYEIAKIYAKRKRDLILVARTKTDLEKLKLELVSEYTIDITILPLDLSTNDGVDNLIKVLDKNKFNVFINNAGFGLVEFFDKSNTQVELNILELNVICFYRLFKYSFNRLTSIKNSYILNVGSVASFLPGPKSAIYFASKSFVKSLTESVQYENKRQRNRVKISLICPPPIETEFMKRANMYIKSRKIKVEKVARKAVFEMERGKKLIFPNLSSRFTYYISKFMPSFIVKFVMFLKINKRNDRV